MSPPPGPPPPPAPNPSFGPPGSSSLSGSSGSPSPPGAPVLLPLLPLLPLAPAPHGPSGPGRGTGRSGAAEPCGGDPDGDHLTILYRGPLASCDYDCPYCPFAKRRDDPGRLRRDRAALERFTAWVAGRGHPVSVLFTPWGEGLVRSWYRRAMVELSHLPHVRRVAIQTNFSCRPGWLTEADLDTLALWVTYHPGQVAHDRFLARCRDLVARGVRFSVGVVGLPEHLGHARRVRADLPERVYVWVNAAEGAVYTDDEAGAWTAIDPLFRHSRTPHPSAGLPCRTGDSVISVDGDGTVRRCHFVPAVLGNLYDGTFRPRAATCPLAVCDCHIGYVHLETTGLYDVFAGGVLERIPAVLSRHG